MFTFVAGNLLPMRQKNISMKSLCVAEHKDTKSIQPHQLPLYATSSFVFENVEDSIDIFTGKAEGHVYSRYGNPTIDTVAQKLAIMEGYGTGLQPWAFLTSSGMSAISTLLYALLNAGDAVLTQANIYGGTTELFNKVMSRHGLTPVFSRFDDLNEIESILSSNPGIKAVYLETPSNPTLDCVDLKAVADLARKYSVATIIDNTFCTPYLQQPFLFGIDYVIHSATKYLNGHGNSLSGAILGMDEEGKGKVKTTLKLMGGTCNAWDAWLLNQGMKTLAIRMDAHCSNAMNLAHFLSKHPLIEHVNYIGLPEHKYHAIAARQMKAYGGMLSFSVKGDLAFTLKVMNNLSVCTQAPTLGDVDTLILHPASSSHLNVNKELRESFGITDNLIRVSVGIEDIQDLIADFEQALQ